jgi:ATP-dependent RNA helicase DDX54/DBP10
MESVCNNAYGKYLRSRPGASIDSIKRSKKLGLVINHAHPVFGEVENKEEDDFLRRMKNYKPKAVGTNLSFWLVLTLMYLDRF